MRCSLLIRAVNNSAFQFNASGACFGPGVKRLSHLKLQNGIHLARRDRRFHSPKAATASLAASALAPPFVLEADVVDSLSKHTGLAGDDLLLSLVPRIQRHAIAPISGFHVGAAGIGKTGRVFFGINVEFPGMPLNASIHAEQFLIANAFQHQDELVSLAVSAAPCGHCRQFLGELAHNEHLRITFPDPDAPGSSYTARLPELLPHRFGPNDLLKPGGPPPRYLLESRHNGLHLRTPPQDLAGEHPDVAESISIALAAANSSYSPYTGSPAGVAIRTASGEVYTGAYMECAAYNPSLAPLQSALVALVAATGSGAGMAAICHVVLVERRGAPVRHKKSVLEMLGHLAPAARLLILDADAGSSSAS